MPKQIIIAEQHRIAAVFSEDQIQELIVATGTHQVGDVYLGVVENVLPGIDAAFVNIGDAERNGFIHVSDLGPLKLQRQAGSITELLRPQQKVLVQVMKEPTGNKGPRLTGNISLPGRYLVLMPNGKGVNLSRRIRNENERNRLRALAILIKPAGMGMVVRTEAEGMPEEAIIEDLESLQEQWESICREGSTTRAPALLNRDDDFIQRVLRDVYSNDVNRIVVDSHTGLRRVKQHLMNWGGGKLPQGVLIDQHRDRIPVLEYFRVSAAIREALKPRVDLPSGGYIIIERTEALTVIDVNSGSFTRSATARETVLWTNCEAATEIARQLRLRNIAGVIIVDFIDMDSRRDQLQVLEHFNRALRSDKARPQIAQLSELGLVELTRKRQGKNIYELFGRPCSTCGGTGHLVHLPGDAEPAEEDAPERVAVLPARELRSERGNRGRDLPDIPLPAEYPWEPRDDDEEDDAPDFSSHPGYQEAGNNNRRRRRRRVGEELTRERGDRGRNSWDEGKPILPAPLPDGNSGLDTDGESEEFAEVKLRPEPANRGRRGRGRRDNSTDRDGELNESTFEKEAAPLEVEEKRGRSRREPKSAEPPELVTVEMTPEEQDVYAWMGISPLVLAQQEVKNPRSAIISVVLPGQAPPVEEEQTVSSSAAMTTPLADSFEDVEEESDSPEPLTVTEEIDSEEIPELNMIEAEQPENGIARRRRRRSSAAT
ncbi:MAG: Rne/Rng family ribonuclease [Oscillatoriales cyanobacterium C42_A2020_001]|nr:Rne/Rng family ribonuclease [Leptolyngbyaceae cyanobacterium C42_A2020_001]